MKYAYYEVVKTEKEKKARLDEWKEQKKTDKSFHTVYIEVAPLYSNLHIERQAMMSLKKAVQNKTVQLVVIHSLDNLYMEEEYAYGFLSGLIDNGAKIAIGYRSNIKTDQELRQLCYDAKENYVMDELSVPLITMEECYVDERFEWPFILMEKDFDVEDDNKDCYEKMFLCDAVKKYRDTGFFLYRADVDDWYRIQGYMVDMMQEIYDISYKIMMESIMDRGLIE